jgi:hypothetical protein
MATVDCMGIQIALLRDFADSFILITFLFVPALLYGVDG